MLFLLMNMGKNGEWKNSLDRFLKFYRENRELIAMVAGGMGAKQPAQAAAGFSGGAPQPPPAQTQTKNRPPEENGDLNVLEEFLKARAV